MSIITTNSTGLQRNHCNWDLLDVAKSEIGSNRKFRSNRFLTVVQFCLDISQTINELLRVCDSDARVIFVVGRESQVRGTKIYNGEIVAEIASKVFGCNLILRQERVFTNRFGKNIYEDILHFEPGKQTLDSAWVKKSRGVAEGALKGAYLSVANPVREDIDATIMSLDKVSPSPLFDMLHARRAYQQIKGNSLAGVSAYDD